jgi:hypothetical protein
MSAGIKRREFIALLGGAAGRLANCQGANLSDTTGVRLMPQTTIQRALCEGKTVVVIITSTAEASSRFQFAFRSFRFADSLT